MLLRLLDLLVDDHLMIACRVVDASTVGVLVDVLVATYDITAVIYAYQLLGCGCLWL